MWRPVYLASARPRGSLQPLNARPRAKHWLGSGCNSACRRTLNCLQTYKKILNNVADGGSSFSDIEEAK